MFYYLWAVVSFFSLALILSPSLFCQSLDTIQIKKISPIDQTAVIQTGEAEVTLIRVGDTISEHATVTDIQADKIIIRYEKDVPETIVLRITGEGQMIERSRPITADRAPLYRVQSVLPDKDSSLSDETGQPFPENYQQ